MYSDILSAALTCVNGTVYNESWSACHASCFDPRAAEQCDVPDGEGCYCPEGLLERMGECVEPRDCGCRLGNDGTFVDVLTLCVLTINDDDDYDDDITV